MIRGLIYLTGLVTLFLVALVAVIAFRVHRLPWGQYVHDAREDLVERLDPQNDESESPPSNPHPGEGSDFARDRAAPSPEPAVWRAPRGGPSRPAVWRAPRGGPNRPVSEAVAYRHVVRRGETLYTLAQRYYGRGERWPDIARANAVRRPSDLRIGRVLLIPSSAVSDRNDEIWEPDLRLQFSLPVEIGEVVDSEGAAR